MQDPESNIQQLLADIYRKESRVVLATLIRLLGDFDLAEDAMHEAFRIALEKWSETGAPSNPKAWLISTGRFKVIDRIRRQSKFAVIPHDQEWPSQDPDPSGDIDLTIADDVLRLIFTCCHPLLPLESRVAMTMREVCGLTTEEIARAFLTTSSTLAQRIVRAKSKLREDVIPFEVPAEHELSVRLVAVLQVIYLVFNEGYYSSSGEALTRVELSAEALRLGRLLKELLPDPEIDGLLGLMLLHEARRPARTTPAGDVILLDDQDRTLWDHGMIREGLTLVKEAFTIRPPGRYTLQAGIAALHAEASNPADTDWPQIAALYGLLLRINPSPVIELNRAVAISMYKGPEAGLKQIEALLDRGELNDYPLAYSAWAELCGKTGRKEEAKAAWERALALTRQAPEQRFIKNKLRKLEGDWSD